MFLKDLSLKIKFIKISGHLADPSLPAGKIVGKAVCRSVFLTTWHCIIFSAKLTKNTLFQTVFLAILPTGFVHS